MRSTVTPLAVFIGACSSSSPLVESESDIIGGVDAKASKFDPVGALLVDGQQACTATLVAPTLAVLAEHCVPYDSSRMAFAIGYDATKPTRQVRVRAVAAERSLNGGAVGLGSDVALLYLSEPIADIVPAALAPRALGTEDLNQKFVSIGYGVQDDKQTFGTRKLGTMTLGMLAGQPVHEAFPSYDAFLSAWQGTTDTPDGGEQDLRRVYDASLIEGYEAYFKREAGDIQACSGDSGGPLLGTSTTLTVWGVGSWVPVKQALHGGLCAGGTIYATFGPAARKFLDDAIAAEAICGGVPPHCEGSIAVVCPDVGEGDRTVTRVDCSVLGLACGVEGTSVACVDPSPSGGLPDAGVGDAALSDGGWGDGGSWVPTDAGHD